MIVISGALVLVALVLLIIGVVGPDLAFVYASIGVSLVSLVFLIVGILQRRGETASPGEAAAAAPAPAPAVTAGDSVTAVIPAQATRGTSRKVADEAPVAQSADEELETGGTVLVVAGRPRYHVEGCRYLSGKQADPVDVLDAREEGFTPCGVCKPDDALAAQTAETGAAPAGERVEEPSSASVEEQPVEEVVEEDVPGVEVPTPTRTATRAVKAPAKAARKAPAAGTAAGTATARKVGASPAAAKAPTKAASKAPGKAAGAKASGSATGPSKAAAAAAAPASAGAAKRSVSVVIIPDRGKYHRAECRYVRGVAEAETVSKTAATRQGYAACGVCKP